VAEPGRPRTGPPVAPRRRRLPGSRDAQAVATALLSTIVVFTLLVVLAVTSPGWDEFRAAFLDGHYFRTSFVDIASAFKLNIKIFCISEVLILMLALGIAVLRGLPGPVFFPIRALAIVYTDVFRGLPTIMVVYMLALGIPALQLSTADWYTSQTNWCIIALTLVYSAYVAEVYRAGIQSVHPSQEAAARSLGLSRWQALRHVVLPQAVRRVVPPLLNDFIGLQKDTALVAIAGPVEAFRQAQIAESANFNFTPYLGASLLFLLLTIPLARFTDYLIDRDRRRFLASGGA
jgi:polar amino acid transport system permease protein